MGFAEADAALVELLVRDHLTLAELATRRDHADPATDGRPWSRRSTAGSRCCELLRALTESDARAAGPAAWSPWRAKLINALTQRAEELLAGEPQPAVTTP